MEVDPGNQPEQEQGGASDLEAWEHDGSVVVPKAKAKGQAKAKAKGKGVKTTKTKGAGGGKREPVTSCICPNCPFPKYPGSRFCAANDHKRAWDNMVYQRRTRKTISEEEKKAFDDAMKDDSHAGKAVDAFARDNPPEMRKKGLVDFAQFLRITGERVGRKDSKGEVPMTEKAFFKHCENVLGLDEEESAELWREYDLDPQIERDSKGFRGALRLWVPIHEVKSNDREHYVDNRVVEGSDAIKAPSLEERKILQDHLRRQDLSFRDEHFRITEEQRADVSARTPMKGSSVPVKVEPTEPLETPEKPVNLTRERPIFHRQAEGGYKKIKADLNKSVQIALAAVHAWWAHPNELKVEDRSLLAFCRVLQFRLEAGYRCLDQPADIVQLVPDSSICSGGSAAESTAGGAESSAVASQTGLTGEDKTKESENYRKNLSFHVFLDEVRTQQQKFWKDDVKSIYPLSEISTTLIDEILDCQDTDKFLNLKKRWAQIQPIYVDICKGIKQSADDAVKHMKVKVAESVREKKRKSDMEAKDQLNKVREEAKAAADAIKKRKTEHLTQTPALFTTTWPEAAAPVAKTVASLTHLPTEDWEKPWVKLGSPDLAEELSLLLGDAKVAKTLTTWGGQYKKSMSTAKLSHVTFPVDAKSGLDSVNGFFRGIIGDHEANISSVKGGDAFMEAGWLFGCSADMKNVGFNSNHASIIKVLVVGEIRHLLLEWSSFKTAVVKVIGEGADKLSTEEILEKLKGMDESKMVELHKHGCNMLQCLLEKQDVLYVPTGWLSIEVAANQTLIYGIRKSFFKGSYAPYKEAIEIVKAQGGKSVARMEQICEVLKPPSLS